MENFSLQDLVYCPAQHVAEAETPGTVKFQLLENCIFLSVSHVHSASCQ